MKLKIIAAMLCFAFMASFANAQTDKKAGTSKTSTQGSRNIVATVNGAGPVKLCMNPKKLPTSFEGLYDRYEKKKIDEYSNEYTFYKDAVVVMRATAWNSGGAEGISYIIIPKGSPLKVKVASKQYLKTGDLMTDAWIKTGKKELFDGTGECVDMMNETLFPIAVTYENDSNGNTNYVYALFDRKAAKKSLTAQTPWLKTDINPQAIIEEIMIYFWENQF